MAVIVLIVAGAAALTAGDVVVRDRLTAAGHTVTLRSDEAAELTSGFDGFVICSSAISSTVGTGYVSAVKPGIVCNSNLWDEHSFATTISAGSAETQWDITPTTGLDAALSGTQTVYSSNQTLAAALITSMGAGRTVVGVRTVSTTRSCYFVFDTGAALVSGTAPARRVGFGLTGAAATVLTAAGLALLDAAIAWAFPPAPAAPPAWLPFFG